MSGGSPFAAFPSAALVLAAIVLVPAAIHATDSHVSAKQEKAKTQTTTPASDLSKPTASRSPAVFTRLTPLSEAIDILRHSTTPPLSIVVLWKPLNSTGVYPNTPIGIDGMAKLRVGQVLNLLTLSLSAGASAKIGYMVDNGVIIISTIDTLAASQPVTRVYDISDLVAPPARYSSPTMGFGMGYGGPAILAGGYAGYPGSGMAGPTIISRMAGPSR
jgi:hypothetical protein